MPFEPNQTPERPRQTLRSRLNEAVARAIHLPTITPDDGGWIA